MAKRKSLEDQLAEIHALAEDPRANRDAILARLGARSSYLVAKAVEIVAESSDAGFGDVTAQILAAFDRFMQDPIKRDPGCHAKIAIVDALAGMGTEEGELLLRAVRHRQLEPSYGPPVDTAVNLRVSAAMALARMNHPDLFYEVTALLMDPEPTPRIGAAKVLEYCGGDTSQLLLRLKIANGDPDSEVTAECLQAVSRIAPERSLPFVSRYLADDDSFIAESAALAIGEMRSADAFACLVRHYDAAALPESKRMLLLPIALTRQPEAIDLLVYTLESERFALAEAGLEALRIYIGDTQVEQRIAAAVLLGGNTELAEYHRDLFCIRNS